MTEHEIISAFLDHEPVNPRLLAEALADPAGRQFLVESLALKALVEETEEETARGANVVPMAPSRLVFGARRPWLLAAAATVMLGLGSFAIGREAGRREGPMPAMAAQRAPEPQRVIELREGIEWHQAAGGN